MHGVAEVMQPWLQAMDPVRPMVAMIRQGLEAVDVAGTRWEEGARQMLEFWSSTRRDAVKVMGVTLDTLATEAPVYVGRLTQAMAEASGSPRIGA